MDDYGWVSIHRKLKNEPWFKKPSYTHLWIYLLLSASHREDIILWNGGQLKIKPGQILTGREKISRETGIPQTTIERILKRLQSGHQIGQQKTSKYRLITLLKWDKYQQSGHQNGRKVDTYNKRNNKNTFHVSAKASHEKSVSLQESETNKLMHDPRKFDSDHEPRITLDGDVVPTEFDREELAKKKLKTDIDLIIQEYEKGFADYISDDKTKIPKMPIPALRKIVKVALRLYPAQEIIDLMPTYFRNDFYRHSGWALWTLCSAKVLNQLKNE